MDGWCEQRHGHGVTGRKMADDRRRWQRTIDDHDGTEEDNTILFSFVLLHILILAWSSCICLARQDNIKLISMPVHLRVYSEPHINHTLCGNNAISCHAG